MASVPPTSTTAIAGSRKRWPMLRKETVENPVISTPASAEQKPLSMYTPSVVQSTRTPESRATRALLPTAKMRRPKVVRCSTT